MSEAEHLIEHMEGESVREDSGSEESSLPNFLSGAPSAQVPITEVEMDGMDIPFSDQDIDIIEEIEEVEYVETQEDQAATIMSILKPVSITMILVIWVVKVISLPELAKIIQLPIYIIIPQEDNTGGGSSGGGGQDDGEFDALTASSIALNVLIAVVNALGFIVIIVVVTFVLVLLYKYRCTRLIYTWLILSTGILLFFFGSVIAYFMLRGYNLIIDGFSFIFIMWNFAVVGVIVIFFYGPRILNQGYLVLISAFLAIVFTRLPDWTTWAILAGVAIYDVFAVLCPGGPLNQLVRLAQERGEPIPALLYQGLAYIGVKAHS